jgi:hypothetical protein
VLSNNPIKKIKVIPVAIRNAGLLGILFSPTAPAMIAVIIAAGENNQTQMLSLFCKILLSIIPLLYEKTEFIGILLL